MKNILSIVACGCIGFGAISCSQPVKEETPQQETIIPVGETKEEGKKLRVIAMVNSDSILTNYEYALSLRDDLTRKSLKYESILREKESNLRRDMEKLQRDAPTLSQFEGQSRQQKLIRAQEDLQLKQEDYARKLMVLEQDYNRDIHNAINEYLDRYCADKPYEMVLSNSDLGIIRWAHESLDITDEVLAGLNEEYAAQNNKETEE